MPPSSSQDSIVPLAAAKRVNNFKDLFELANEFNVGVNAKADLANRGERLILRVKPIIMKHAADEDGCFRMTWKAISTQRSSYIGRLVNKSTPWLLCFEEHWATDWVLKRLIDQRVHDEKRKAKRKLAVAEEKKPEMSKAVVEEPDIPSGSSSEAFDPPKTPREGRLGKWNANKKRIELNEKLKAAQGKPRPSKVYRTYNYFASDSQDPEDSNADDTTPTPPKTTERAPASIPPSSSGALEEKAGKKQQAAAKLQEAVEPSPREPRLKKPAKRVIEEMDDRRESEEEKRKKKAKASASAQKRRC